MSREETLNNIGNIKWKVVLVIYHNDICCLCLGLLESQLSINFEILGKNQLKEPRSRLQVTANIVRVQDGGHSEGQNIVTKVKDS